MSIYTGLLDSLFRDKTGKIVVIQKPNLAIYLWIIFKLGSLITETNLSSLLQSLSLVALLVWAVMELISGVNYFRKILGLVVLGATIANRII
jgi:hypothetical protein